MWCFSEGFSWWPWFGGFWMFIIGGGLLALIVWGINRLTRQYRARARKDVLDIVRERYAKGEIDQKEFEKIIKDLG